MTTHSDFEASFRHSLITFTEYVIERVQRRWTAWEQSHENHQTHEVIGALLARQATLLNQFALNPSTWNPHSAPLFLRSMIENCITTAYILKRLESRAKEFIAYGLGQAMLLLEHLKADLPESETDPDYEEAIANMEHWLNSERATHLIEVNIGNWITNLRVIAEETNLIHLHRKDYTLYSATTHNMWHHFVRFNLEYCTEPLHGNHRIPRIPTQLTPDPVLLQCAAEYFDMTINLFEKAIPTNLNHISTVQDLNNLLQRIPPPPGYVPDNES